MINYKSYVKSIIDSYPSGMRVYRALLADQPIEYKNVLHLGCGRDLKGMLKRFDSSTRVVGLDPDAEAIQSYPGEGHVGDGADMPFDDNEFDLVFSEMVLEHLQDPSSVFSEVARVLKPGGRFISVTPNFYSYKSLIAAITPHWFHRFAVRVLRRESARQDSDVYPTVYKANTYSALQRLASSNSLILEQFYWVDNGPTWFQRLPGLFEIGRLYHLLLKISALAPLRCNIVIILCKPLNTNT